MSREGIGASRVSRLASTGGLASLGSSGSKCEREEEEEAEAEERQCQRRAKSAALKTTRAKRCRSLLTLSSPFSSSATSSMKSSLMSLLHPNQQQQQQSAHELDLCRSLRPLDVERPAGEPVGQADGLSCAPAAGSAKQQQQQQQTPRSRCVKMKLFEQPLDKLFSPKAMKQLNSAINSPPEQVGKRKRTSAAACLRKLSLDTNNNSSNSNNCQAANLSQAQRQQLMLNVLPEPIRNLLNQLYLRGPTTVGIFRKSPNAKHCKELRQKLETDSQSSIEQFQVTVIASVFKEWLRSLPDCLLMSRLYPQWIDVAKLIEPLYSQPQHHQSQSLDDSHCDSTMNADASLRPSRSPLTDNGQQRLLDRARSCSTMMSAFQPNMTTNLDGRDPDSLASNTDSNSNQMKSLSAFALSERLHECLRIVRQLLDALNQLNLILLRSFICVLWHIANNSEYNKMSASNLGICVGQSLLNDEHQSNYKTASTFTKRHRRARSQCILSSTLSLTNFVSTETNCAQETAKYVPMLVAFLIENAPALFGPDIMSIFSSQLSNQSSPETAGGLELQTKGNLSPLSINQTDGDVVPSNDKTLSPSDGESSPRRQHILVESSFVSQESDRHVTSETNHLDDDTSAITSILIVNHPSKQQSVQSSEVIQRRPLSSTESTSTSSSRASSSTSGVHSNSPAFSNELDSNNARTSTSSPSTVSSPSPVSSNSPVQESHTGSCDRKTSSDAEQSRHLVQHQSTTTIGEPHSQTPPKHSTASPNDQRTTTAALDSNRRNNHKINRYSTFVGVLNRVPKIPVQYTTSNYGGEAVIYNPKPRQTSLSPDQFSVYSAKTDENRHSTFDSLPNDSVISVKPLRSDREEQDRVTHQNGYHTNRVTVSRNLFELREQRVNDFLAHQYQRRPLASAPSLSFLPTQSYPTSVRQSERPMAAHRHSNLIAQQCTASNSPNSPTHQRYQPQQHPVFYSTTNLSTLQQSQQHDRYLLLQNHPQNQQRSHVLSLRDYYLSLQQNQQFQQQQLNPHRGGRVQHPQLIRQERANLINNLHQQPSQRKQQEQQRLIAQIQYATETRQGRTISAPVHAPMVGMATHQTIHRPQTRLARIRQNQINGSYLRDASGVPSAKAMIISSGPCDAVAPTRVDSTGQIKLSLSDHSSADESDESMNEWTESTMV